MIIVGIDYSMTSPAACIYYSRDGASPTFTADQCEFVFMSTRADLQQIFESDSVSFRGMVYPETYRTNTERFYKIAKEFLWPIPCGVNVDAIAIEGYSFGSSAGRAFDIAENTGLLKYKLFEDDFPTPLIVTPTQVKKFATGKGNAKKPEVVQAFYNETGLNVHKVLSLKSTKLDVNPVSDIADSYFIAKMMYEQFITR